MPNITSVINDQIRRLARREINANNRRIRRLTAQHRRDIAALKRQMSAISKSIAFLERQEKRRIANPAMLPSAQTSNLGPRGTPVRFRADGLRTHRAKLGLSAKDYGQLVGASGLSVYNWEAGKSRPRKSQVMKLVSVRGLGKREALKRLETLG